MPTYSVSTSRNCLKRNWDGECVVYRPDSRETHLLSAPCALVFSLMDHGAVSGEKLHGELALVMEEAEDIQVSNLLREILDSLSNIGLIETHEGVL